MFVQPKLAPGAGEPVPVGHIPLLIARPSDRPAPSAFERNPSITSDGALQSVTGVPPSDVGNAFTDLAVISLPGRPDLLALYR